MQRQARTGTAPERALRSALWRRGLRFRVNFAVVGRRRRVDIAFTRRKVAVFVDGCFWHQCPSHGTEPKNNAAWWKEKLRTNVERDRDTDRKLSEAGWIVIRVWEHDSPDKAADRILNLLTRPGLNIGESHSAAPDSLCHHADEASSSNAAPS